MARVRSLRRPPITEAIIDFRIDYLSAPERLAAASDSAAQNYPRSDEHRRYQTSVELKAGSAPDQHTRQTGWGIWRRTDDEKTIAQFRDDGFTLNRLSPYTGWDQIFAEALGLWGTYAAYVEPHRLTRIALRYINHIPLPDMSRLSEYIRTAPRSPVSHRTMGFSTQIFLQHPDGRTQASVTQVLDPAFPTLLLDVDTYRTSDLEHDSDTLATLFARLHEYKNKLFFQSLTERLVEEFE